MKKTHIAHIVVVGAGPVGAVAALAAAQKGFTVTLIEEAAAVNTDPRAATTHPSTLEMLASLGLIDEFTRAGLVARYFQFWDRPTRTLTAEFDHDLLRDETPYPFVVQTEQHKLSMMSIRRLRDHLDAQVLFSTRLTSVGQDADRVTVIAEGPEGPGTFTCDYLIGADGGRSIVRKSLDIEFEGYTWPERFIVLTTLFDYERAMGCCYRNYLAGPEEWTNLFKVAGDDGRGRWRAVFPTRADESDEEALGDAAVEARMQRVLPSEQPYDVIHRNLYNVHQRVAARFRHGRAFLAGDAAHVNNPIGGLGLNCGIHDAMELVDTLFLVSSGATEPSYTSLLDRYERRRRPLNIEYVQQQTIANKKRLEERDPIARQARADELRAIAADPARHKQFLMRSSLLESVRRARSIE